MTSSDSPTPTEASSTAERLRQIATELFAERGYAGTSLAEIASRLGIRKPSLYNYYRSKDDLFLDLFASSLEGWRSASRPPLEAALAAGAEHAAADGRFWQRSLYRHLRHTLEFGATRPHALGLCRVAVAQVTGDVESRVLDLLETQRRDFQDLLERFFAAAVAAGEVVDQPTSTLAFSWLTFVDGVITHQLFSPAHRQRLYLDRRDELWTLYWRGIACQPEIPALLDDGCEDEDR